MHSPEFAKEDRLIALIDPPTDIILMDERVAQLRGLRGFGYQSLNLSKSELLTNMERNLRVQSKTTGDQVPEGAAMKSGGKQFYKRRAKIDESQRQVAQISITHDGDMAVAVCMASDEPSPAKEPKSIVDDGTSPPMHEPQWADDDFLDPGRDFEPITA